MSVPIGYLSVLPGNLEDFKKDIADVLTKYGIDAYQYAIKFGGNKVFVGPVGVDGSPQLVTGVDVFVHPKIDSAKFTQLEVGSDECS